MAEEEPPDGAIDEAAEAESAPEVPTAYGVPATEVRGVEVLHPDREAYVDTVAAVLADGFEMIVDLCGVDYLTHPGRSGLPAGVTAERYEIVVNLLSHRCRRRVRVRVQVPEDDPTLPTLFDLHPGVETMEREAYDMIGVVFTDHPDLERILMPTDWQGHPLRKDFAVGRIPVQFKGAPDGLEQHR